MKLKLKVVPGASSTSIEWLDCENAILKVRVTSPPEKNQANKAVIQTLSDFFDLPTTSISILSGHTGPRKTVKLSGVTMNDITTLLPE